jgi:hypothetical protein
LEIYHFNIICLQISIKQPVVTTTQPQGKKSLIWLISTRLPRSGGKEVSAPKVPTGSVAIDGNKYKTADAQKAAYDKVTPVGNTLYGVPKKVDTSMIRTGLDVSGAVPPEGTAAQLDRSIAESANQYASEEGKSYLDVLAKQKADYDKRIAELEAKQTDYDKQMQSDVQNPLNEITSPFRADLENENNKRFAIEEQINTQQSLVDDLVSLSKQASIDIQQGADQPGLARVVKGNVTNIKDTYNAKIAFTQAAIAGVKGSIDLARSFVDRSIAAIEADRTDRITYLNFVKGLIDEKKKDTSDLLKETRTGQKATIDNQIKTIQSELAQAQENRELVQAFASNPDTAAIASKAGILLTDTPAKMSQKLMKFYTDNPQYSSSGQETLKNLVSKYPDAGILPTDTLASAYAKIKNSIVYQGQVASLTSSNGSLSEADKLKLASDMVKNGTALNLEDAINQISMSGPGVVGGYDISKYATDPNHEKAVASILQRIGKFNSVSDIDAYIKQVAPGSPITGAMVESASAKFGVSWEMMVAMMQQDSSLGTAGKGARTFNPGNVGNNDRGDIVNFGNWQSGVDAVAKWLAKHKVASSANTGEIDTSNPETAAIMSALGFLSTGELSDSKLQQSRLQITSLISQGKTDEAKERVKNLVYDTSLADQKKAIAGRNTAIAALGQLKADLQAYYAKGGKTGFFVGLEEDINRKIGKTKDADLRQIQNRIMANIQAYRSQISGAAFTASEAAEYNKLFPSIGNVEEANFANIDALTSEFGRFQNEFYRMRIGADNFDKIFNVKLEDLNMSTTDKEALNNIDLRF